MTKLGEIEMGTVLKLLAATAVILLTIVLCGYMMYNAGHSAGVSEFKEIPSPTAIATPTPIPTPAYPSVLTYTVLSMTTSTGYYQITTTAGQILYVLIMRITSLMIYKTHTHHPLRARRDPRILSKIPY